MSRINQAIQATKKATKGKIKTGRPEGWSGPCYRKGHEVYLIRGKAKIKAVIKDGRYDQTLKTSFYTLVTPRSNKVLGEFERAKIERA